MAISGFTLHRPADVAEACNLGARFGRDAAYLAGGTELLVDLRSGRKSVAHVIDLGLLEELAAIRLDGDELVIGALARLSDVASSPLVASHVPVLPEAIGRMAGRQIRNLGTIGGNVACGVPCSDTPPVICAVGGEIGISGPQGGRRIAAREFVLAPRVTALEAGEIVGEIRIAAQPRTSGASYQRFGLRRGSALAVASVAAWVDLDAGRIAAARLVMGAVGPVPLFAERAARSLVGEPPAEALFAAAGAVAADEARPICDLRGSDVHRRDIVAVLAARALAEATRRAEGGAR